MGTKKAAVIVQDVSDTEGKLCCVTGFTGVERDWREGSAIKNTDCSSRGPEFNSQQPHGGSQPSGI